MKNFQKILLAEDNPKYAELILLALQQSNLLNDVVRVKNGAEALDYLYKRGEFSGRNDDNPIGKSLIDLKMPKVDGLQVIKQIKSDENLRTIPTVVLTSSREEQDLIEGYKLGINAYVVKPVEYEKFADTVKNLGVFWALINEPPV